MPGAEKDPLLTQMVGLLQQENKICESNAHTMTTKNAFLLH